MPAEKTPWDERTTLLRPPPPDKSKAPIENALEVTELAVLGPVRLPSFTSVSYPAVC